MSKSPDMKIYLAYRKIAKKYILAENSPTLKCIFPSFSFFKLKTNQIIPTPMIKNNSDRDIFYIDTFSIQSFSLTFLRME